MKLHIGTSNELKQNWSDKRRKFFWTCGNNLEKPERRLDVIAKLAICRQKVERTGRTNVSNISTFDRKCGRLDPTQTPPK
ncbi:hypothetical protein EUGRSUZ_J00464 [Eucalyptus grandis]|uniref:Uncharacterized protein n=2 Tax=Eucalyptus grandis TaxID=71139 RepID=A0ACC3J2W4_EUCGR|nr:hypothetical protein EUGRSUZ_J00464 [Eucalyptus grandis]